MVDWAGRVAFNGPSCATRLRVTMTWPRRQVIITIDITSPIASDSHAPCSTLAMLELKKRYLDCQEQDRDGRQLPVGGAL
jgi:hypothetical protein